MLTAGLTWASVGSCEPGADQRICSWFQPSRAVASYETSVPSLTLIRLAVPIRPPDGNVQSPQELPVGIAEPQAGVDALGDDGGDVDGLATLVRKLRESTAG